MDIIKGDIIRTNLNLVKAKQFKKPYFFFFFNDIFNDEKFHEFIGSIAEFIFTAHKRKDAEG